MLSNEELEWLILTQFTYAMTLAHELVMLSTVRPRVQFIEANLSSDCEIAEGGFDLEAAIFGRLLNVNIIMTTRQYAKNAGLCRQAKTWSSKAKNVLASSQ